MTEWAIALTAAGAAIIGSLVTGWYTRGSGIRQADAALESVRLTIRAGADQRALDLRRQAYAEFLGAAETRLLAERTGKGGPADEALLQRALGGVTLEGPDGVTAAAQRLVDGLRRHRTPDELNEAKREFVAAARKALTAGSGSTGAEQAE